MYQSQDPRELRGLTIQSNPKNIIEVKKDHWKVKSQSGNTSYNVIETPDGIICSCPDFYKRGLPCKHIIAVRLYLESSTDALKSPANEHEPRSYTQAWSVYNAAQVEEMILFNTLLKDLVEIIPQPEQTMGRPRLPIHESLFCAIQKVYSQLSSRRAHSLFQNAVERKQIDHAPHFNTPSKLFNDPNITHILNELVTLSAMPVADLETDFAIDSTGFRTTTFSAYTAFKYGQKKSHRWIKAHMVTGVKTNIVTSIEITDENGADSPQFKPLVEKTSKLFKIGEISADLAYSSRDNIETVTRVGGVPYIPFKKSATGKSRGSTEWSKMYHYFQFNRDEFMEHYHKRSNVESTIAAIKRKFGETLKSKNHVAQVNELLAKIIAYNLTVVIHAMYEHGISPDIFQIKTNR